MRKQCGPGSLRFFERQGTRLECSMFIGIASFPGSCARKPGKEASLGITYTARDYLYSTQNMKDWLTSQSSVAYGIYAVTLLHLHYTQKWKAMACSHRTVATYAFHNSDYIDLLG